MKYLHSLFLALSVVLIGCSKPVSLKFDGKNYYQVVQGSLVAFDGKDWYQQRKQDQSFGDDRGSSVGQNEEWVKLTGTNAGSHVSPYHRNQATSNNTNLPPVFVR
jgi:hypothetical protein